MNMENNDKNKNMFDDAIETILKFALAPVLILLHDVFNPGPEAEKVPPGEYERLAHWGPPEPYSPPPSRFDAGGGDKEEHEFELPVETSPEEVAYRLAEIEAIERAVAESFARDRMEKALERAEPMLEELGKDTEKEQMLNAIQETIQGIQDLYEESCISYPR